MNGAEIGAAAAEALRVEARLTPKPGLVDQVNSGAHRDMDLSLMLRSADVLEPFFIELATAGDQVDLLQRTGIHAEQAMLAATGGVNTHQGAIYSLGLVCAASGAVGGAGQLSGKTTSAAMALNAVGDAGLWSMVSHLALALEGRTQLRGSTRSSAAALGLGGARAQAASGMAVVRTVALPAYLTKRALGWCEEDALLASLVSLFAHNDDTNLVVRGGRRALLVVRRWATEIEREVNDASQLRDLLTRADRSFIRRNWSPGGSADLLAVTWLVSRLGEVVFTNEQSGSGL